MFDFIYLTSDKEQEWDDFLRDRAVNGCFLQSRRFLNYHPEGRFKDRSLLVYNSKENIAALVPGCEVETEYGKTFFSHKGTTFGGIITDKKHYCAKHVLPMVEELTEFLRAEGYKAAYLKQICDIFSVRENALFQYAFGRNEYTEFRDLNTYVDFAYYKDDIISNLAQGKRTNVHNCIKEGVTVRKLTSDDEVKVFYDILCENLSKYDVKPVHTVEELLEFKNERLTEECGFYGAFLGEKMIAGGMMFYFKEAETAHTQYLAARQEYNKLSPMTFMYYSMLDEMKKKGYKRLSWGIATEDLGRYLNMGLVTSKEDFGSRYISNYTFFKEL